MASKRRDSVETLAERIERSKKEKEDLKAKLQNLIDSGINSTFEFNKIIDSSHNKQNPITTHSDNKVQILKSYDANHSQSVEKPTEAKIKETKSTTKKEMLSKKQVENQSPKKVRNYNAEEAREYIKRQREKRLEEMKSKRKENVNIVELQKQKLQELHKKSRELVSKNVSAKRERSKSRERGDYVRPDVNNPSLKQQFVSRERLNEPKLTLKQNRSLSCDRLDKLRVITPSVKANKSLKDKMQNVANSVTNVQKPDTKLLHSKPTEEPDGDSEKKGLSSDYKLTVTGVSERKKCPDLLYLPDHPLYVFNSENASLEEQPVEPVKEKNLIVLKEDARREHTVKLNKKLTMLSNITLRKPVENMESSVKSYDNAPHIQNSMDTASQKNNLAAKPINIFNYKKGKDTKETQTNIPEPAWLNQSVQPDPFNFINAVRRKLEDTIAAPKITNDVGIQAANTLTEALVNIKVEVKQPSNQNTSEKSSKHSDLKSFISHKCLDLDPKSIRHMELSSKNTNKKQLMQKNATKSNVETNSESDTSKNIPEISSESAMSLKPKLSELNYSNHKDNLNISTGTIDNMKLQLQDVRHIASCAASDLEAYFSDSQVVRGTKNKSYSQKMNRSCNSNPATVTHPRENRDNQENMYSSDFHSNATNSDVSPSRNSIISYNKSNYSKISPGKSSVSPTQSTNTSKNIEIGLSASSMTSLNTQISHPISISHRKVTSRGDILSLKSDAPISSHSNKKTSLNENSEATKATNSNISKKSQFKSLYSELHTSPSEEPTSNSSSKLSEKVATLPDISDINSHVIPLVKSANLSSKLETDGENEINTENSSGNSHSKSNGEVATAEDNSSKTGVESGLPGTKHSSKDDKTEKEPHLSRIKDKNTLMKNVSIRSLDHTGQLNNTNEIHLKFEAEIHLLNDFNESLKHFAEVEKAFHSLRVKNNVTNTQNEKIMQHRDTQTSTQRQNSKTSSTSKLVTNISDDSRSQISTINYTRGSDINEDINSIIINSSVLKLSEDNGSLISAGFDFSQNSNTSNRSSSKIIEAKKSRPNRAFENVENLLPKDFAGMSLSMFDQLIHDEDIRLENLKTILKIREQALLDRTKAELAWLEIQRKHLKETGKLQEASLVKKKQRGILLKHQQETHEMHRLKQMQKAESIERKTILKAQRNIIKHQLSTENMLSTIKMNTSRKSKHLGPLKVIQTQSESARSETSISVKSSADVDIHSVTSYSVVSKVSETSDIREKPSDFCGHPAIPVSQVKRTLLMRESALQKRRKAAEELLQWHKKLLEEEKRIKELEETASAIISQIPNVSSKTNSGDDQNERKYKFGGHQLNQLWLNLTSSDEKKFKEDKVYPMSQMALERFCKSAKEYSHKSKDILKKIESDVNSSKTSDNVNELGILNLNQNIPHNTESPSGSLVTDIRPSESSKPSSPTNIPSEASTNEYTSDFDVDIESINEINIRRMEAKEKNNISSISELIDNFSKIKTDISALRMTQEATSKLDESSESLKTEQSILDEENQEVSVIETTKTSIVDPSLPQGISDEVISQVTSDEVKTEKPSDIDSKADVQSIEETTSKVRDNETSEVSEKVIEKPESPLFIEENIESKSISSENEPSQIIAKDSKSKLSHSETEKEEEDTNIVEVISDSRTATKIELTSKELSNKSKSYEKEGPIDVEKDKPQLGEALVNKEDINAFEEKEQDSLSSIQSISTDKNKDDNKETSSSEETSTQLSIPSGKIEESQDKQTSISEERSSQQPVPSEESKDKESSVSEDKLPPSEKLEESPPSEAVDLSVKSEQPKDSVSTEVESKQSKTKSGSTILSESVVATSSQSSSDKKPSKIDVKKRVSEILADASPVSSREDKSPRLQDLYTTTYDLVSPAGSPEMVRSPTKENKSLVTKDLFGNEAEELLKKQLAIEQEIKEITEQQQKEQVPFLFVREIPNKPPPPYTPPGSSLSSLVITTILPTNKEVEEITKYSAKIIHKAYLNNNLEKIMISDNTLNLIAKNIDKSCYKFVFDLCKEIAIEHYNQFKKEDVPAWLEVTKKQQLAVVKQLDVKGLEKHMNKKLLEIFGFRKPEFRENTIIKWSRKKRDHVDEILVIECQAEEPQWTNFDKDELLVINGVTDDIMNLLLKESTEVFNKALSKKGYLH